MSKIQQKSGNDNTGSEYDEIDRRHATNKNIVQQTCLSTQTLRLVGRAKTWTNGRSLTVVLVCAWMSIDWCSRNMDVAPLGHGCSGDRMLTTMMS